MHILYNRDNILIYCMIYYYKICVTLIYDKNIKNKSVPRFLSESVLYNTKCFEISKLRKLKFQTTKFYIGRN